MAGKAGDGGEAGVAVVMEAGSHNNLEQAGPSTAAMALQGMVAKEEEGGQAITASGVCDI